MGRVTKDQYTVHSLFSVLSAVNCRHVRRLFKEEGLDVDWSVTPAGVSVITALDDGSVHVAQSTLSQNFTPLMKAEVPPLRAFCLSQRDGWILLTNSIATYQQLGKWTPHVGVMRRRNWK